MQDLILIADDDPVGRQLLQEHFEKLGFHVVAVGDGLAAVLKARELRPNVLIFDIQMPGIYGPTAYSQLQEDPSTAAMPVVFISGRPNEAMIKRLRAIGPAAYFMGKPFSMKELSAMVLRILGKEGGKDGGKIKP